jgi:hypothetical protein
MPDFLNVVKDVVFRSRSHHAIPVLDGPLTPNRRVTDGARVGGGSELAAPEDVVAGPHGVFVSSGNTVVRIGDDGESTEIVATLPAPAGGLALDAQGALHVCAGGSAVLRLGPGGTAEPVTPPSLSLTCALAIAVADGRLYVAEGSDARPPADWVWDWADQQARGRILAVDFASGTSEVLAAGLRWPAGLALATDGRSLLFTESWGHRVSRLHLSGPRAGSVEPVVPNLPGYPARIHPDGGDGYWVAMLGLRTHLLDFIVTQRGYMREMTRTVNPEYWIRPRLRPVTDLPFLAPMQGGGIIVLGRKRYSAPPLTYGLAVHIDAAGGQLESIHDREGGDYPGIVAVASQGQHLFVASKGGDAVVRVPAVQQPEVALIEQFAEI